MVTSLSPFRTASLVTALVVSTPATSRAALYEPERVDLIGAKAGAPEECGISADYLLSGATLRVEIAGAAAGDRVRIMIRAYEPNAVGPVMNDLWLKTRTLFTPPNFKPARMNSNGILEASGEVERETGVQTLKEVAAGEAEIAIIFDGVLPAARLPVGLPRPLPAEIATALRACADRLGAQR